MNEIFNKNEKYLQFYKNHCFSLDARTFGGIRDTIFDHLNDIGCPAEVKLLYGEFIFKKIYMNYKPSSSVKTNICQQLENAINECDPIVLKSLYLQYHDTIAMSLIASHFYVNRYDQDKYFILQLLSDTQLIKNYLQSATFDADQLRVHFLEWLKKVELYEQRSNILDVLLKNYGNDKEVKKVYDSLRFEQNSSGPIKNTSIYSDAQNVHDTDIQISVNDAAAAIMVWYECLGKDNWMIPENTSVGDWLEDYMKTLYKNKKDRTVALAVVTRSRIDITSFSGKCKDKSKIFTISDILCAIVHYIHYDDENRETLTEILLDEMKGMAEFCSSGYIARLINVLQGFNILFTVTISVEKQLYAVISHKIMKAMEKAPDKVIEGSIDDTYKDAYLGFIENTINNCIFTLINDYGTNDLSMFIENIVTKISGNPCKFANNRISFIKNF